MIGGILGRLVGPRVLIGAVIILTLGLGITFAWAKSASKDAIEASEALSAALLANAELDTIISELQAQRAKTEAVLASRERRLKSISSEHAKLAKRLSEVQSAESKIWLNTNIPVDVLGILRESEGEDHCKGRENTTPKCAST